MGQVQEYQEVKPWPIQTSTKLEVQKLMRQKQALSEAKVQLLRAEW